ncbi:ATP phosphoribosyltransferase regulatory subunit [Oceanicella actignis]|uniref:ATP phosphoribosyltransferase regulatory subunit n=1 Tax=Oceanicella actignis TaxID=1189325 RepID=UPI0011E60F93|nr:ATP phosphoribosyltransferase regulatory subunit [Oceanicella actignis]TYO85442.1 ATP phosphoribosyltransferase regulatory subunit [Oceanicella actignis]
MAASRAYLPGGRLGAGLAELAAETARINALFAAAGAVAVEPETLQPADIMLELYGEDIRARAFVTHDPVAGDLVLRPDFTAPVVRLHMAHGATPARYAYCGPVWRRQEPGSSRPTEYLQAGVEILGAEDPIEADAEAFDLIRRALGEGPDAPELSALTGDLAVALAMIDTVEGPERRRAALRRHIWRPARFRALLESFGPARPEPGPERRALLEAVRAGDEPLRRHIRRHKLVGLRGLDEIMQRARQLAEDAALPPLDPGRIALIERALAVRGPSARSLAELRDIAAEAPALTPALDRMEARLEALARRGVDAAALPFDASFGRALEYYDGFVFEFRAPAAPHLPPLGGGGRYDALTRRLGGGRTLPAVGGVVRPEALIAARRAACDDEGAGEAGPPGAPEGAASRPAPAEETRA